MIALLVVALAALGLYASRDLWQSEPPPATDGLTSDFSTAEPRTPDIEIVETGERGKAKTAVAADGETVEEPAGPGVTPPETLEPLEDGKVAGPDPEA